jgi:hypothetical protein
MAQPDFDRSVNPISTRGDRLCPPNYYWHIFRPSDGPEIRNVTSTRRYCKTVVAFLEKLNFSSSKSFVLKKKPLLHTVSSQDF